MYCSVHGALVRGSGELEVSALTATVGLISLLLEGEGAVLLAGVS